MSQPQQEQEQQQQTQEQPVLTPNPHAKVEPPQPPPGGVDAVVESEYDPAEPAIPDPDPEHNPETSDDEVPAEAKQGEDTDTQATKGEAEGQPTQESPA